jgi:hypothetical protein
MNTLPSPLLVTSTPPICVASSTLLVYGTSAAFLCHELPPFRVLYRYTVPAEFFVSKVANK